MATVLVASVIAVQACGDENPVIVTQVTFGKPAPAPNPEVETADPSQAIQGVTLDVRVNGKNFENGAAVTFLLNGKATGKVVTNSTSFMDDTEVVANITIAPDAEVNLYDIEVRNSRKRKGIGTELFSVQEDPDNGNGGGGPTKPPVIVELTGDRFTSGQQDAALDNDTKRRLEINGPGHEAGECQELLPGVDETCFVSGWEFGDGVDAGNGVTGFAACTLPAGMSDAYGQSLFARLTQTIPRALTHFDAEVDKNKDDAWFSIHFYEGADRYVLIQPIDSAVEIAPDVWKFDDGQVNIGINGDGLKAMQCPWVGTFTMTISR